MLNHRTTVASVCDGRDNNFNFIRVVASLLVILTHAFGFTGNEALEPLKATFNTSFGSAAVDIFFLTSGFLVCRSWDNGKSVKKYVLARIVRIYPALWVCTFICVFAIGIAFTSMPVGAFLSDRETVTFFIKNTTLLKGTSSTLPGVFVLQGDGAVNTSLWTIHYEVKLYVLLLILGWSRWLYLKYVPILIASSFGLLHIFSILAGAPDAWWTDYVRFGFLFFTGCTCYLLRSKIVLRHDFALGLLTVCIAALAVSTDLNLRRAVLTLSLPYWVFYFAYIPRGPIRRYNQVGDYSYGIYLYGAPVQQIALAFAGGTMTVAENFLWSVLAVIPVAMLSWHGIERRALQAIEEPKNKEKHWIRRAE